MIELFQALEKVSGNGGSIGGDFLSDHPLTSDRIKHTAAADRGAAKPAEIPASDPAALQQLAGMTQKARGSKKRQRFQ